ncbi:MAG: hypothetical protein HOO00_01615 [Rhodospirillaceae bacterium]|jgi:truncated hemoglobin YjbI|nr:hypothetical protein [Rhodospirillaceae bacterium]MBT5373098.1 hypothetical protein [Rhodospirillaceae bacterium]MBT5659265.1 hypothetical protein [Rhodospirillaceae bacterium]MBT5752200.1 hypothetical protein [Rhodospirillaceae bacterium]
MGETLLHEIGGENGLRDVMQRFLKKAQGNPDIGRFFIHSDPTSFAEKTSPAFFEIFDNPGAPPSSNLASTHNRQVYLGLSNSHFDVFLTLFAAALTEQGVTPEKTEEAINILDELRGEMLSGYRDQRSSI